MDRYNLKKILLEGFEDYISTEYKVEREEIVDRVVGEIIELDLEAKK